jgi:hypothetical protein
MRRGAGDVAGNYGRTTGVSDGWPANFSVLPLVGAMPSGHGTREVNWPAVTRIFAGHQDQAFLLFCSLGIAARRVPPGQWRPVTNCKRDEHWPLQARP